MTHSVSHSQFLAALEATRQRVDAYLFDACHHKWFEPEHIRRAVLSYPGRPAKRLRPTVLLLACSAVGGDETDALPAAAGVEMFHTWTLVHDDLIDNDSLRRGQPSVHEEGAQWARDELAYDEAHAREYGRNLCILAGDIQHAWAVVLFLECARSGRVRPDVVLALTSMLESSVINQLLHGEMLDIQYSRRPIDSLTEAEVVEMLRLKTAVLYQFAATAGACIGSDTRPGESAIGQALAEFSEHCGIAFQLQDDILGVVGDEALLGKPIGSDIREGKRTVVLLHAWGRADSAQRRLLDATLGNPAASPADLAAARSLLAGLGGVAHAQTLARMHLDTALAALARVPDSPSRALLNAWAEYMLSRTF